MEKVCKMFTSSQHIAHKNEHIHFYGQLKVLLEKFEEKGCFAKILAF